MKKAGTHDVLKYADEGFSGELMERPGLNRLREDAKKGLIDKLICYDPDRLSRKLMNQLILDDELRKQKITMVFVNGEYANSPEGQLFFSLRGAISEFEKAKIKERTSSGRLSKAKKGKVVKNSNLFGYDYNKEKETYEINEEEANIVRMIFDYYTDPKSRFKGINGIALHLSEIGVKTKNKAKVWHRQVVRQILMNKAYTGDYVQNRWDTVGSYVSKQSGNKSIQKIKPEEEWVYMKIPSIISEEQFNYAQDLLGQGRRRSTNYGKHDYLLSGLVRCGVCNGTMTGRKRKSHGKDFFIYECRKNYAGAKYKGCGKSMSENKLNRWVWEGVQEFINNPDKISVHQEKKKETYQKEELEMMKLEIEKAKKGRQRLIKLISLSDDDIDIEEIKEQMVELQQKENNLKEQYTQMEEVIKGDKESSVSQIALKSAIDYYRTFKGKNMTLNDQRDLIRLLVKQVIIKDSETVDIITF